LELATHPTYQCRKDNGGMAGMDSQSFTDIERYGVERWLKELESRRYRPLPVWRVYVGYWVATEHDAEVGIMFR
jgi:RNA-directed DNA polymerase